MQLSDAQAVKVFDHLLANFKRSRDQEGEVRWQWLTAAHIVGQHHFPLHVRSHLAMLGFALRTADWPEAGGQLFRLALVPLGHLTGRLPAGNIGRATVSAFAPMPLDARSRELILAARLAETGASGSKDAGAG